VNPTLEFQFSEPIGVKTPADIVIMGTDGTVLVNSIFGVLNSIRRKHIQFNQLHRVLDAMMPTKTKFIHLKINQTQFPPVPGHTVNVPTSDTEQFSIDEFGKVTIKIIKTLLRPATVYNITFVEHHFYDLQHAETYQL
jgi:hypothetical protein